MIAILRLVYRCDQLVIIIVLATRSEANIIIRCIARESTAQLDVDDEKR